MPLFSENVIVSDMSAEPSSSISTTIVYFAMSYPVSAELFKGKQHNRMITEITALIPFTKRLFFRNLLPPKKLIVYAICFS
jgi:hypothetical protein